ncbi:hypothetical protein bpr_I2058 [Butyrivibrio proteoclasticus B316]|jgi:hypothetical protein|uniref:Type 4 fimbrial biogenesis protein PilX N-terminal domain-containing protein n=1 Tax=Butyrivibrio proteoclasticus (strain ATCC 51982 / DSM 14932 / B316) TaxID=515622 RepID=E0RYU7_BUTPB|nr:hypothetical protein [Butyrivibrio proteoclasticus]ADL34792.1 hypothetical protein bpr_I2058 [Butyrivibrio proteoclasticus B316]
MEIKRQRGINVGSASILLIFTVLSLVSFATLTLVNSKADYNLSQNLAERQSAYYNACHSANAYIAAINSGYEDSAENGIIKKSIPITDNQSLDIALMSNIENNSVNSTNKYTITQWQIVNHADSDYDYTLPVFK